MGDKQQEEIQPFFWMETPFHFLKNKLCFTQLFLN